MTGKQLLPPKVSWKVEICVRDGELFALSNGLNRTELHFFAVECYEAVRSTRVVDICGGNQEIATSMVIQVDDALRIALEPCLHTRSRSWTGRSGC